MQKSKNRQELFDNTINHFNSENRGVSNTGGCRYRGEEGTACAIGREISDKLAEKLDKGISKSFGLTYIVEDDLVFNCLPTRLKKMGKDFLYSLQLFHDDNTNWCLNGLSGRGIDTAKKIATNYKLRTSSFEAPF